MNIIVLNIGSAALIHLGNYVCSDIHFRHLSMGGVKIYVESSTEPITNFVFNIAQSIHAGWQYTKNHLLCTCQMVLVEMVGLYHFPFAAYNA